MLSVSLCLLVIMAMAMSSPVEHSSLRYVWPTPRFKLLDANITVTRGPMFHRIMSGNAIHIDEAPFYIQLTNAYRDVKCGGTLITERHVVTAAHCIPPDAQVKHFKVVAGADAIGYSGTARSIKNIYIHPQYNLSSFNADVAVIETNKIFKLPKNKSKEPERKGKKKRHRKQKASGDSKKTQKADKKTLNPTLKPQKISKKQNIQLPIAKVDLCTEPIKDGDNLRVVGWGLPYNSSSIPKNLQSVDMVAISQNSCAKTLDISDNMICTLVEDNKDACSGDSGGPAMLGNKLCGIVSWGKGCGVNGRPGVYISVPHVLDFINSVVNGTIREPTYTIKEKKKKRN